jgi:hypothetical protein
MHRKSIRKSTEKPLKIVRKFIKNVEKWGGEPMTAKSTKIHQKVVQKGGQNGAKSTQKWLKEGHKKRSKNEEPTNRLKAEKRPAAHPRGVHFWSQGRDKGRGKPLPYI